MKYKNINETLVDFVANKTVAIPVKYSNVDESLTYDCHLLCEEFGSGKWAVTVHPMLINNGNDIILTKNS